MATEVIIEKQHVKGGYPPYHLSEAEFLACTREATQLLRGLMPAHVLSHIPQWIDSIPANSSAAGSAGQMTADSSWLYVCVATDTWRRTPLASF